MNKQLFCANCQQQTDHSAVIDQNQDMVLTCAVCERAVKFPTQGMMREDIDAAIIAHQDANEGQEPVQTADSQEETQATDDDALLQSLLG